MQIRFKIAIVIHDEVFASSKNSIDIPQRKSLQKPHTYCENTEVAKM